MLYMVRPADSSRGSIGLPDWSKLIGGMIIDVDLESSLPGVTATGKVANVGAVDTLTDPAYK